MVFMQLNLEERESNIVEMVKKYSFLDTKQDAIKAIIRWFDESGKLSELTENPDEGFTTKDEEESVKTTI